VSYNGQVTPAPPPLPPGRTLALPGRGTTFVRDLAGPTPDAPTVFLLHGLGATADVNWFPSYFPLARHFRVVAMDHRGHGRGIRSWRPFRLEDCADDVAAVADALGLDRAVLVGYSMGGPIAQLTWRRHRDLVAGLVLCATARSFASRDPRQRLLMSSLVGLSVAARITPAGVRSRVTENLIASRVQGRPQAEWAAEEFRRGDTSTILQAASAIGRYRATPWIGEVDVPTAVVVTERDTLIAPVRQHRLAESIPGAVTYSVDGDHAACVMAARRFVPVLVEACANVVSRSQSRNQQEPSSPRR
jgi:pimeloyl-ACP methyl ester carboxylesterase